jgi:hypothetical protein
MANKWIIVVFVLLGVSVAAAAAREVLLTIEMTGTVTTTTELTLYTIGDPGYIWADVGDPVTAITIPSIAENTIVSLGTYYLVNTGTTDVTVTYDTQETNQGLPLYVMILASEAWVNADGSVEEVSEHMWTWYYDKTPYEEIYNQDGTLKPYTNPSISLVGGYAIERGSTAVEIGIRLSAQNIDVAVDTPFTLQLSFSSDESS